MDIPVSKGRRLQKDSQHVEFSVRYGELFDYCMSVRHGITGLWQISGRNDTTYKEQVVLDVWYSRNWSLWFDNVIIVRTVPAVLFRSGAY